MIMSSGSPDPVISYAMSASPERAMGMGPPVRFRHPSPAGRSDARSVQQIGHPRGVTMRT